MGLKSGLRDVKGCLAIMLLDAHRASEAEALWRTALVAKPAREEFEPSTFKAPVTLMQR
jgi:hypothetical protein